MANGGDILEISYNNPVVGSGIWFPRSNEDSTFDLGGIRNQDDANMLSASGGSINIKNRVRWYWEGTVEWDANGRNEPDIARQLAESVESTTWTIQSINGTVWKGVGTIVGDIQGASNTSTMPLKISGGGLLKKIIG